MKAHCLFEQSGTFKNEFIKLGIDAKDYDIQNEFGETDFVCDLFDQIDRAYAGEESIFDGIAKDDLVFAFFPCTRFQECNSFLLRGLAYQMAEWDDEKKIKYAMQLHEELHEMYMRICKLFLLAIGGGWKMIVENPYTQPHYLTLYFPIKPKLTHKNRRDFGDIYAKPTQYWFVNFNPKQNFIMEALEWTEQRIVENAHEIKNGRNRTTNRSMIHPQYAERFIREYII